ncbi:lysine--tRNA ligase [Aestuariivirga sp.]|uniref:lysine--tRNA ligase n=1 Tax=Aestuariivirga sp. TaxID=2650926 RepID=UPI003BAB225F
MTADSALRAAAETSKAWPFEEARKLVARIKRTGKTEVLFETGYGPSGLPHIGTFGEVARTTMVRRAFELLCDVPTRLLCFSDDMDGMRKIPETVPDPQALKPYLHMPLTAVPNPFGGDYASFGDHNNAMLRRFLDTFGFQYEFASATDYYKSGRFDTMLLRALEKFDDIMAVMLPSLGEERQATYSPFLPISPLSGRVLYVPMKKVDAKAGTITFTDEDGADVTMPVTGGNTKLQWKPDFGMRWAALGVDFEMFGKDHQTNAPIYDRICEILGAEAPEHYVYELFLDDKGQKISKSKGNGLTIDEWLTYADPESLALFMFNKPREAKRLYFDVIPRAVDDYGAFLSAYQRQAERPADRLMNPVWHIHGGNPPAPEEGGISFSLLLNLAAVANAHDKSALWGFIQRYQPDLTPESRPRLDALVAHALRYFDDFVKPKKQYRPPTEDEAKALSDLSAALGTLPEGASPEEIQQKVYDVGRHEPYKTTQKDGSVGVAQSWFNMLYQVLLGEEKGPRFGSFVALYGIGNTRQLIERAVNGKLAA